jgi:galactose mutarotase-like enzyme
MSVEEKLKEISKLEMELERNRENYIYPIKNQISLIKNEIFSGINVEDIIKRYIKVKHEDKCYNYQLYLNWYLEEENVNAEMRYQDHYGDDMEFTETIHYTFFTDPQKLLDFESEYKKAKEEDNKKRELESKLYNKELLLKKAEELGFSITINERV